MSGRGCGRARRYDDGPLRFWRCRVLCERRDAEETSAQNQGASPHDVSPTKEHWTGGRHSALPRVLLDAVPQAGRPAGGRSRKPGGQGAMKSSGRRSSFGTGGGPSARQTPATTSRDSTSDATSAGWRMPHARRWAGPQPITQSAPKRSSPKQHQGPSI